MSVCSTGTSAEERHSARDAVLEMLAKQAAANVDSRESSPPPNGDLLGSPSPESSPGSPLRNELKQLRSMCNELNQGLDECRSSLAQERQHRQTMSAELKKFLSGFCSDELLESVEDLRASQQKHQRQLEETNQIFIERLAALENQDFVGLHRKQQYHLEETKKFFMEQMATIEMQVKKLFDTVQNFSVSIPNHLQPLRKEQKDLRAMTENLAKEQEEMKESSGASLKELQEKVEQDSKLVEEFLAQTTNSLHDALARFREGQLSDEKVQQALEEARNCSAGYLEELVQKMVKPQILTEYNLMEARCNEQVAEMCAENRPGSPSPRRRHSCSDALRHAETRENPSMQNLLSECAALDDSHKVLASAHRSHRAEQQTLKSSVKELEERLRTIERTQLISAEDFVDHLESLSPNKLYRLAAWSGVRDHGSIASTSTSTTVPESSTTVADISSTSAPVKESPPATPVPVQSTLPDRIHAADAVPVVGQPLVLSPQISNSQSVLGCARQVARSGSVRAVVRKIEQPGAMDPVSPGGGAGVLVHSSSGPYLHGGSHHRSQSRSAFVPGPHFPVPTAGGSGQFPAAAPAKGNSGSFPVSANLPLGAGNGSYRPKSPGLPRRNLTMNTLH